MINTILKKTVVTVSTGLALSALTAMSFHAVNADSISEQQVQISQGNNEDLSPLSDIDKAKIDPHVVVVDNRFELIGDANNIGISNETYENAKNTISKANEAVKESSNTINSKTKSAAGTPGNQLIKTSNKNFSHGLTNLTLNKAKQSAHMTMLGNSNYTYSYFWWGCRYYFTSNAAVAQLVHEFHGYSSTLTIGAAIAAPLSPAGGFAAGAGAWYFDNVAENLEYYNSTHMNYRVYLDMAYSLNYSFGTF